MIQLIFKIGKHAENRCYHLPVDLDHGNRYYATSSVGCRSVKHAPDEVIAAMNDKTIRLLWHNILCGALAAALSPFARSRSQLWHFLPRSPTGLSRWFLRLLLTKISWITIWLRYDNFLILIAPRYFFKLLCKVHHLLRDDAYQWWRQKAMANHFIQIISVFRIEEDDRNKSI